jgi:hypothetical protein
MQVLSGGNVLGTLFRIENSKKSLFVAIVSLGSNGAVFMLQIMVELEILVCYNVNYCYDSWDLVIE